MGTPYNAAKVRIDQALDAMKNANDPDYNYYANHKLTALYTDRGKKRARGTVLEVGMKDDRLAKWLGVNDTVQDPYIEHGINNIKHIFWLTVFFDTVAATYAGKAAAPRGYIFDGANLYFGSSVLQGNYLHGSDLIWLRFTQADQSKQCTSSIYFPTGHHHDRPIQEVPLVQEIVEDGQERGRTISINQLSFRNII